MKDVKYTLTKKDIKFFKDKGIISPILHLKDLMKYEQYVDKYFPQISDEAWSYVQNDEEEEEN